MLNRENCAYYLELCPTMVGALEHSSGVSYLGFWAVFRQYALFARSSIGMMETAVALRLYTVVVRTSSHVRYYI